MGAAFTLIFSGRCKSGHAPFPLSTLCVIMGEEMWVLIFLFWGRCCATDEAVGSVEGEGTVSGEKDQGVLFTVSSSFSPERVRL